MEIYSNFEFYEINGNMIFNKPESKKYLVVIKRFSFRKYNDGRIKILPYVKKSDYQYEYIKHDNQKNIIVKAKETNQLFYNYTTAKNLENDIQSVYTRSVVIEDLGMHSNCITDKICQIELDIDYKKNVINTLGLVDIWDIQFSYHRQIVSSKIILPKPEAMKRLVNYLESKKINFIKKDLSSYKDFFESIKIERSKK